MRYAKVILPLPLNNTYTYSIPPEYKTILKPGFRVIVPFGRKKYYTGIVEELTDTAPKDIEIKDILMVPDNNTIVRRPQIQLWNWVADYYLCTTGEVFKAALPGGLKIESETFVELSPEFEDNLIEDLTDRENIVIQTLISDSKNLSISEIEKKTGFSNLSSTINKLMGRELVVIHENIVERYHSKKEIYIRILFDKSKQSLQKAFDAVKGAKKQEIALLAIIEVSGIMRNDLKEVASLIIKQRTGVSQQILQSLAKKGLIEFYKKEINRFSYNGEIVNELPVLSTSQKEALNSIHSSWNGKNVTLLRGVTSSGKTEIYIHLSDFVLKQHKQVLYLVPEIALTTQLTSRLQKVFGDKVIIYHSKFTDNERVDIWNKLLKTDEPYIIVGARSAVFLPFGHLGLIIVDEEHDSSYKQQDPAPRYSGRDTAIMLSRMHGAKTLLGSATPAIDTYYKALTGKYGLVELTERYGNSILPEVILVDYSIARKKREISGPLVWQTRDIINESLKEGHQSIIFLNRRGYAPIIECKCCGWSPKCDCCDVTLTYHKKLNSMVCHYCGNIYPLPFICPACKEPQLETLGYGTERIEDEIETLFEGSPILRMDKDTTRNKDDYETLISNFSNGKAKILVGTQMVTKGLDFGKVNSVAVINTDLMLNIPDFRASERAFNTLEQVAGRSGRRDSSKGTVIIQTYSPHHPVMNYLKSHDYTGFYNFEIAEREKYLYPPFTRLIYIYIKHKDIQAVEELSIVYTHELHRLFGNRVFGPEEPYIGRIQSMYIRKIMLKIEVNSSMEKVRKTLKDLYIHLQSSGHPYIKSAHIYYDVDPV